MKTMFKFASAATLAGALALASMTPGHAEDGRNAAAAIGFGAGALVGAAAVNAGNNGYYYYGAPSYSSYGGPTYAAAPAHVYDEPAYAYEPSYTTVRVRSHRAVG